MPGEQSVQLQQYYANPGNCFWWLIERLFNIPTAASYENRRATLIRNQVALWDVLERAVRNGSTDKGIIRGSEIPNNFSELLGKHPSIRNIYFNGQPAAKDFRRLVVPELADVPIPRLEVLPSTSPAHTIPRWKKLGEWSRIKL
jgi:TDG/mug DNA glycosylase family protein